MNKHQDPVPSVPDLTDRTPFIPWSNPTTQVLSFSMTAETERNLAQSRL